MLTRVLVAIPLALSPALLAPAQVFICEFGRPRPHFLVNRIIFRSPISLAPSRSLSLRNHIVDLTRGMDSQKWARDLRDQTQELIREAYEDEGYLKAEVHADVRQVSYQDKRVNLIFHVYPGKQYRIIEISFRGMTAFSEDQLAKLIPYEPGSIFIRSTVAAGLQALKKFYDSHGYINEFFNRFFRSPLQWVRPEDYTALHIDDANRLESYKLSLAPSMR